jgi:hypothetical protein
MQPPKPGAKPAISTTQSTTQPSADQAAFKERAAKMAQEYVDNLNRNVLADQAKAKTI